MSHDESCNVMARRAFEYSKNVVKFRNSFSRSASAPYWERIMQLAAEYIITLRTHEEKRRQELAR